MAFEIPILVRSWPTGSTLFLENRVVRLASGGNVVHTTGVSTGAAASRVYGVTLNAPAASTSSTGRMVSVGVLGVFKVEASSGAIAVGDFLRPTSGAVSAATRLGGTVKKSTSALFGACGIAESSAAAGTGKRLVAMRIIDTARL